jgi:uncharacterized protein with PQ loop repeat
VASKSQRRRWGFAMTMFTLVLVGVSSWALYSLLNQAIEDVLAGFGIINVYAQGGIILFIAVVILMLLGAGLFKAVEKIVRG